MRRLLFTVLMSATVLFGCQSDTPTTSQTNNTTEASQGAVAEAATVSEDNKQAAKPTAQEAATQTSEDSASMEVAVFRDGSVEIDGESLAIDAAIEAIKAVSGSDTTVFYYREGAQEEPHPNAMTIIATVMESQLALTFSSEPDFSTVVTPDGQVKPRN